MKNPRFRMKIHFKNPRVRPIKATVGGSVAAAEAEVLKVVGRSDDEVSHVRFTTVWGQRIVVAANEILYIELEET